MSTHYKSIIPEGTQFGRLTVMYLAPYRLNRGRVYHCKCECGAECDIRATSLKSGDTKSCGCLSRELSRERNKNKFIKDLTGQRFGKLIAIEPTEERQNGSVVWKCKCDCGNECKASSHNLHDGNKQSCGCLRSKGELKIRQLLIDNNIPFIEEYSFSDLKSEKRASFTI